VAYTASQDSSTSPPPDDVNGDPAGAALLLPADSDFIVNAKAVLKVTAQCGESPCSAFPNPPPLEINCQLVGSPGSPVVIDQSIAWVPTIPGTQEERRTANVTLALQGPFSTDAVVPGVVTFSCTGGVVNGVGAFIGFINSKIQALNIDQLNPPFP